MNGSGLRDEASFPYDADRLSDERQPLQADLLAALTAYLAEHPELQGGDLVTLEEPGLSGYTVCAKSNCVTTDAEGNFQLVQSDVGSRINITIKDPNAGTPALEMRYTNKWKGEVTVPEYTREVDAATMGQLSVLPDCGTDAGAMVCKQDAETLLVRDQYLNDTATFKLSDGFTIAPDTHNEIGLMQGFLTLPINYETYLNVTRILGYDHEPLINYVSDYKGNPTRCTPFTCFRGTDDAHNGLDFGLPSGSIIIATTQGNLETWINTNSNQSVNLRIKNNLPPHSDFEAVYGHLLQFLTNQKTIYRGLILAQSDMTGTQWSHLHFDTAYGQVNPNRPDDYLDIVRAKDPFGVLEPVPVITPLERYSLWTVFNLPQYP